MPGGDLDAPVANSLAAATTELGHVLPSRRPPEEGLEALKAQGAGSAIRSDALPCVAWIMVPMRIAFDGSPMPPPGADGQGRRAVPSRRTRWAHHHREAAHVVGAGREGLARLAHGTPEVGDHPCVALDQGTSEGWGLEWLDGPEHALRRARGALGPELVVAVGRS